MTSASVSRAAAEHARREPRTEEDAHRPLVGLVLVAAVAAVVVIGLLGLPREGADLPAIAREAMTSAIPTWGTTDPVNAIVYGSRGFDTFGETFLLLAAVVSVTTLARRREPRREYVGEASAGLAEQRQDDPHPGTDRGEQEARAAERQEADADGPPAPDDADGPPAPDDADGDPLGLPGPERAAAMTVLVRVAARTAAVPLAVAAVHLAAWGYSPGGGFPAGVAVAGVVLLLYAAYGHRALGRIARPAVLEPLEMAGAAIILAVGLVGLARAGSMFANWLPLAPLETIRSGGTTQLFSGAELVEVGTGLTIAIFALLGLAHDWTPDEDRNGDGNGDDT